jgi:Trk K+ transport system NAD-binding subunit
VGKVAHLFESRAKKSNAELGETIYKKHIVIVGAHRLGSHLISRLQKEKEQFILIDFNPDVISHYHQLGVPAICGDIADPYIQEVASLRDARMIICTIPDFHDTLALLEAVRFNSKKRAKLIVTASDEQEALELYAAGADYVLLPHFVGGVHLAQIVERNTDARSLHKLKEQHLKTLHKSVKV